MPSDLAGRIEELAAKATAGPVSVVLQQHTPPIVYTDKREPITTHHYGFGRTEVEVHADAELHVILRNNALRLAAAERVVEAGRIIGSFVQWMDAGRKVDKDESLKDDQIFLHYSGPGCSIMVSVGQMRAFARALSAHARLANGGDANG